MGRHADDQRSRGVARWVVVGVIVVLLLVGSHGRLPDRDAQQRHRRFRMPGTGQRGGRRRPVGVARRRRCRRRLQRRLPGGPIAVREGRGHDGLGPGRAGRPDRQDLAGRPRPGPGTVGPRRPCLPGAARHRPAGSLRRPPDRPRRLVAGRPGDPEGGRRGCRSLGWSTLPQSVGSSGSVTLSGDRHLVLALPDATANPATGLAGQSVVAGTVGTTVAVTSADVTKAAPALEALQMGSAPSGASTSEALDAWRAGAGTPRPFRSRRSTWWRSTPRTADR